MKFLSLIALSSLASQGWAAPHEKRQAEFSNYLMVYFTGEVTENGESVSLAVSNDNSPGSWTEVNNGQPLLLSDVGTTGIRDPTIIRAEDGSKYWIIATDLKVYGIGWDDSEQFTTEGSKGLVIWESEDLATWSEARLVTVSPDNAGMTWAPDGIWDREQGAYMVYWTSNLIGDGWYTMRAFTNDFVTFTEAEKMEAVAGMDSTIAFDKSSDTYYLINKNGPDELIEQSSSSSLNGDWTVIANGIGEGVVPAGEGPLTFKSNTEEGKWHLWIDNFTAGGGYAPLETTDIASGTWTASSGFTLPEGNRHGYVIPITDAEREAVLGAISG